MIVFASVGLHGNIFRPAETNVHRIPRSLHRGDFRAAIRAIFRDQLSLLVNAPDDKFLEIIQHDEIRPKARRDRAMIAQPIMARGVDRAHLDRRHRSEAELDRLAN